VSVRAAAVIVAGGTGSRIGGPPKQFREIGGHPMLAWSCERFVVHPEIDAVVVVVPAEIAADPPAWLRRPGLRLAAGGATRRASVRAGLVALTDAGLGDSVVLIHDAARPFVSAELIGRLARAAVDGAVIPVLRLPDTIKRMGPADDGGSLQRVEATLDRECLRAAQTPQAFPFAVIHRLHEEAASDGIEPTDDADLCERAGIKVRAVPGERLAWKVTHPEDLATAEWLVASGRVAPPGSGP
jgi:2-C-methyl-D-erythritol 4-phosphate cytidylyltransferase/2-C-methyl-D-erythritol 2,4-cyclodiphosphate synthase